MFDIEKIKWDQNGLIPAIIQNADTGKVLMLGYMNSQALNESLQCNQVIFYSRSKQRLWKKGETSGNFLNIVRLTVDCDQDSLLIQVKPAGPTCHNNTESCFGDNFCGLEFIKQLEDIILDRKNNPKKNSYVSLLFSKGVNRISQKVGEEAIETVLAATQDSLGDFLEESADLLFHLLILLSARDTSITDVLLVLYRRR